MNREPRRQRTYFILLLVTAFALLTIDYHSNGSSSPLHPLEKLIAGVVGPKETAVNSVVKPITDEVHFGKQPNTVAELQKELAAAKLQAELSQNDHRQVEQFDKLMGWPPYYVMRMKPARVVGTGDTLSSGSSVTIDMGTRDGLHINMTVVTGLGLIGNVIRVNATTSTVQLLIDPLIYVHTKNARTNTEGFVQGLPDGNLALTQISQTTDIRVGDYLVTYGSQDNQPYVPNVPVGVVTSVNNTPGAATHAAIVKPFASFNELDIVAVIFPPATKMPNVFISPVTPNPTTAAPTTSAPPSILAPSVNPSGSAVTTSGTTTSGAVQTSALTTSHPPTTTPPPHTTPPPTSKPATSKPATSKPATSKPATSKPATSKPATSKPATSNPPATTTTPPPPVTPTP
jgi:rod shape-determining protein MreC